MPLDKSGSKQSFGNNVKAEMDSGKPQNQAVAIAYSVEREREKGHSERHEHERNKYGK